MTLLVEWNEVSKIYDQGKVAALQDVSLAIDDKDFVAVVGKSGCGKTTMLHLIGGLDKPTTGRMWFNGEPMESVANIDRWRSENVGVVFQSYYLLPNLNALENVQLPMLGRVSSDRARIQESRRLLECVGLSDRSDHLPSQLSQGQCQRVAIARALANRPRLLLADEPTGSLDSQSGKEVMELLRSCHRHEGMTVVMVTHDNELAGCANRVIRMQDGRIVASEPAR